MYLPRRIGGVATAAVALVLAAGIGLASEAAARLLFRISLLVLPLLFLIMALDKVPRA